MREEWQVWAQSTSSVQKFRILYQNIQNNSSAFFWQIPQSLQFTLQSSLSIYVCESTLFLAIDSVWVACAMQIMIIVACAILSTFESYLQATSFKPIHACHHPITITVSLHSQLLW